MKGYITLALVGLFFVAGEIYGRTVIALRIRLAPAQRARIVSRFVRGLYGPNMWLLRHVGGARLEIRSRIPSGRGVLLLMNHQSLMDIPAAVACLEEDAPRFVTRRRYGRGIPLISLLSKLLDCPLVDPGKRSRRQVEELYQAAQTDSPHPLLIFPEGTRTLDGEIGRFKRGGLRTILSARSWSVYLIVVDGFWKCARFQDFTARIGSIRGVVDCLGPFPSPAGADGVDAFCDDMRDHMCIKLNELRNSGAPVS